MKFVHHLLDFVESGLKSVPKASVGMLHEKVREEERPPHLPRNGNVLACSQVSKEIIGWKSTFLLVLTN